jgi:hypothetical protein
MNICKLFDFNLQTYLQTFTDLLPEKLLTAWEADEATPFLDLSSSSDEGLGVPFPSKLEIRPPSKLFRQLLLDDFRATKERLARSSAVERHELDENECEKDESEESQDESEEDAFLKLCSSFEDLYRMHTSTEYFPSLTRTRLQSLSEHILPHSHRDASMFTNECLRLPWKQICLQCFKQMLKEYSWGNFPEISRELFVAKDSFLSFMMCDTSPQVPSPFEEAPCLIAQPSLRHVDLNENDEDRLEAINLLRLLWGDELEEITSCNPFVHRLVDSISIGDIPSLGRYVSKIFSVCPASEACCERLFSSVRQIATAQRSRLSLKRLLCQVILS